MASAATQHAGRWGREASTQARELAQRAQGGARSQQAVQGLRDLGRQVRGLSEGRPQEGLAADVARQLATRIDDVAARHEERGLTPRAAEDPRHFPRRRPGLSRRRHHPASSPRASAGACRPHRTNTSPAGTHLPGDA